MKAILLGVLVVLVGCGSGGGGGSDSGPNLGMSPFTGTVSGAATGSVSGVVEGTAAVTGSSGATLAISQSPAPTLPAGLQTLSMSLYFTGAVTARMYTGSDFMAAAVAISLPDGSQYGASLAPGSQGLGTVNANILSVNDGGVFVTVRGSIDATLPAAGSATGALTLHLQL